MPSVAESVLNSEKPVSWFGLFGPAGLPKALTERLQSETSRALNAPDVRPRLEASGFTIPGNSPDEFAHMIRKGFEVYGDVFKAAGLKPED